MHAVRMTLSPCESVCADLLSTRDRGADLADARAHSSWLASSEHARTLGTVWRASRTQRWPGRRSRSSRPRSGSHSRATRCAHLRRHGSRQPVSADVVRPALKRSNIDPRQADRLWASGLRRHEARGPPAQRRRLNCWTGPHHNVQE